MYADEAGREDPARRSGRGRRRVALVAVAVLEVLVVTIVIFVVLGCQARHRSAQDYLVLARDVAMHVQGDDEQWWLLNDVAKAQARAGDYRGALKTDALAMQLRGRSAGVTSDDLYKLIAKCQAEAGDLAAAKATAERIKDRDEQEQACRLIALAFADAGDTATALRVAEGMADSAERHRTISSIAWRQAARGDFPGAKATADGIRDRESRDWAYQSIASELRRAGKFSKAEALIGDIADTDVRWRAQDVLFSTLVKRGDWDGAMALARRAPLVKSSLTFAEAAYRAGASGPCREAIRGVAARLPDIPDTSARAGMRATVAALQAKLGDTIDSRRSFDLARRDCAQVEPVSRLSAYMDVAKGHWDIGDTVGYRDVIRTAREFVAVDTADHMRGSVADLAPEMARVGDVRGAISLADTLEDSKFRDMAYGRIGHWQIDQGDTPGGITTTARIRNPDKAVLYRTFIVGRLLNAGDMRGARDAVDGLLGILERPDYPRSRDDPYGSVVFILLGLGDLPGAETIARRIGHTAARAEAYRAIARQKVVAAPAHALDIWIASLKTPLERAHAYLGAAQRLTEERRKVKQSK